MNLVFDIETDGLYSTMLLPSTALLSTISKLKRHIRITILGIKNRFQEACKDSRMRIALLVTTLLATTLPVIHKLYNWFDSPALVVDTLLLSRLYHADMMSLDKKHLWEGMPLKLYGKHSLESYGYRLNEFKGDFGSTSDWKNWSQEMEDYCIQDVHVTTKLWHHFQPYLNGLR